MRKHVVFFALFALLVFVLCNTTVQGQDEPASEPEATMVDAEPATGEAPADAEDPTELETGNSCIDCHSGIEGKLANIVEMFMGSVHREMDFTCEVCHGGDPNKDDVEGAMDPEAGFIGKPDRLQVPFICAKCHSDKEFMKLYGNLRTDQFELYQTSAHGKGVLERGDTKPAVCIDCHTAHNILRVKNPKSTVYKLNLPATCSKCHGDEELMGQYGLDYTIPQQYMEGEHGKRVLEDGDLGAPVCHSCHGNHGATPPGVDNIDNVCGQCHLQTEKLYNNSLHSEAFDAMGMGRCIVCHNQHKLQKPTDRYFDEEADANCGMCHTEDTEQYDKIIAMSSTINDIRGMHERAGELVEETEQTTHLSMHEMIPQVEQIRTKLLTARILQHGTNVADMVENRDAAQAQFTTIEAFTQKLLKRAAFNKRMVLLLAFAFCAYGLLMWAYRKFVLDHLYPWQEYEGEPLDSDGE